MTEPDLPPSDGALPPALHDPVPQRGEPLGQGDLSGLPDGSFEPSGEAPPPEGELAAAPPADAVKRPSYLFPAVVSTLSVVADIGTRVWAEKTLVIGPAEVPAPKVIIKGVLTFFLAKNRGGAWGFLQHQPEKVRKPFFVLVSVLAIALLHLPGLIYAFSGKAQGSAAVSPVDTIQDSHKFLGASILCTA